jgi:lauroyl/myristoyl acyltransferase
MPRYCGGADVVGGIVQYALQGKASLSGFKMYNKNNVREMAKMVNSRRAKILLNDQKHGAKHRGCNTHNGQWLTRE